MPTYRKTSLLDITHMNSIGDQELNLILDNIPIVLILHFKHCVGMFIRTLSLYKELIALFIKNM